MATLFLHQRNCAVCTFSVGFCVHMLVILIYVVHKVGPFHQFLVKVIWNIGIRLQHHYNMDQNGHTHVLAQENSVEEPLDPSYTPKLLKTTGNSIVKNTEFECESHSAKILVLYCGGTIGMRSYGGGKCTALNL